MAEEVSEEHQRPEQEEAAIVDSGGEEKDKKKSDPPPSYNPSSFSLNIWPPSERTREAVINRLLETLSTPSVLSRRYGSVPQDEASALARQIEREAFSAASSSVSSSSPGPDSDDGGTVTVEDDGIETLQFYSKEISKRMLESVKARASSSSSSSSTMETPLTVAESPVAASSAVSEDISSAGSETSQA